MKRGTPRHPKVAALADLLSIELYAAVGLLELLWHFTAEYAPAGDIGRHTQKAIARAVHWRKNASTLIDGLVESRWLDREGEELFVHDWSSHADDATNLKLARARMRFYDGSIPNYKRLPSSERALADEFYALPVRTDNTLNAHSGNGRGGEGFEVVVSEEEKPEVSPAYENLPFDTLDPVLAVVKPPVEEWFAEFWAFYWRKVDRANALRAFKKHAVDEETKDRIIAAVKAQTPQYMARDSEHRPHAATWLNARRYEEDPEVFDPGKAVKKGGLTAEEIAAL